MAPLKWALGVRSTGPIETVGASHSGSFEPASSACAMDTTILNPTTRTTYWKRIFLLLVDNGLSLDSDVSLSYVLGMSTAKRQTQQRASIIAAIEAMDCAFTPQQVLGHAQRACPRLGIATVYRSIRDLLEQGRVRQVVVVGSAPRYERTDVRHHHHFHCTSCGEVSPLEGCSLKNSYQLPPGFKASSHEVIFTGTCRTCADSEA